MASKVIPLRASEDERGRWGAVAEGEGLSFNAWARRALNHAAELGVALAAERERVVREREMKRRAAFPQLRKRAVICEHRVPPGSFCKRCD